MNSELGIWKKEKEKEKEIPFLAPRYRQPHHLSLSRHPHPTQARGCVRIIQFKQKNNDILSSPSLSFLCVILVPVCVESPSLSHENVCACLCRCSIVMRTYIHYVPRLQATDLTKYRSCSEGENARCRTCPFFPPSLSQGLLVMLQRSRRFVRISGTHTHTHTHKGRRRRG